MSRADEELSLFGNGSSRVATTSAAKSDLEIIEGGGTKRSEPMQLFLPSDHKMPRVDMFMQIRRWIRKQQRHYTDSRPAPISKKRSRTWFRLVRRVDKLVTSLDKVIQTLNVRRDAKRLKKAAATGVPKISEDREKLKSTEPTAPPIPLLTPPRLDSCQSPTRQNSSLDQTPILDSTALKSASNTKISRKTHRHRHHDCRKTFSSKRSLTRHRFTHLSEAALVKQGSTRVCLSCHEKFPNNGTYHAHLVTHTTDKNFRCDQCGKSFARSDGLKQHQRSHTSNPKPFTCCECDRAFSRKDHLTRHTKTIHQKLKDIACPECGKMFGRKDDMVTHVNNVHLKIRDTCAHCSLSFKTKYRLGRHLKTVHPSESRPST